MHGDDHAHGVSFFANKIKHATSQIEQNVRENLYKKVSTEGGGGGEFDDLNQSGTLDSSTLSVADIEEVKTNQLAALRDEIALLRKANGEKLTQEAGLLRAFMSAQSENQALREENPGYIPTVRTLPKATVLHPVNSEIRNKPSAPVPHAHGSRDTNDPESSGFLRMDSVSGLGWASAKHPLARETSTQSIKTPPKVSSGYDDVGPAHDKFASPVGNGDEEARRTTPPGGSPSSGGPVPGQLWTFANGDTYQGEWTDDGMMHGFGIYTFANTKNRYEGEYKFHRKEGRGVFTYSDGMVYSGEYKAGQKCGKGKTVFPNGNMYEGEYRNSEFNGRGVFSYAHGDRYDGSWVNGVPHGTGHMKYADGSSYQGQWNKGKKDGKGVWQTKSCSYDGGWEEGKMSGEGKQFFADGTKYEGQFQDGKRHGYGRFWDADGSKYEGHWQNDERNGKATYYYPSGEYCVGVWEANQLEGAGIFVSKSGKQQPVFYKQGKCVQFDGKETPTSSELT
eukprot:TRINITY_DN68159_c8_g1_i1.p1 TRINITY_DN68159_c8_g1~~TRINITY_DN68159_c8_g1_i1.p1  ORF type:complete len:506 (-),score=60.99 TRINITY_DN68159_c8_g1_i1:872-2389(-)